MKWFFKLVSVVLHPLLAPSFGVMIFFWLSPIFYLKEIQLATISAVGILTAIIPLLIAIVLRKIGYISSFALPDTKERILPLCINLLITGTILYKLIPRLDAPELYYFFLGILGSTLACLIMVIFKVKASIHMIALSGVLMFTTGLSFHYAINATLIISLLVFLTGLAASSRLYLDAHTNTELVLGIFIGLIPQLLTFKYWL